MNHISEDLPALLTGDATRDVVLQAAAHLRNCVDCQQELVSAVIAHASLTSAHRFAPEIVSPEAPGADGVAGAFPTGQGEPDRLPDLSTLFAEVRADGPRARLVDAFAPAKSGKARRRLLAAAAAAVVVGGGVTAYSLVAGNSGANSTTRTVALDSGLGAGTGSARFVGENRMVIDTKLPAPAGGRQYEVWLTGSDDGRQPVGYLHGGRADMTIPGGVMKKYKGVAVSVQRDGQTEFSGNVVLAGQYG